MKEIPFVGQEHHDIARGLEQEVQEISSQAGILFVGAFVDPFLKGDSPKFSVIVGCSRSIEEDAVRHLLWIRLGPKIPKDAHLEVVVFRGVAVGP